MTNSNYTFSQQMLYIQSTKTGVQNHCSKAVTNMTVVTADCAVVCCMMTATLHGAATSTNNQLFAGTNIQSTSPIFPWPCTMLNCT